MVECPTCKKQCGGIKINKYFPFCCGKCKDVDLYDWLFGIHGVAVEPPPVKFVESEDEDPKKFWRN